MTYEPSIALLHATANEWARRIRDAEPGALARWLLVTFQHADGSYETMHARDASFLRFAAERGVPSDELRAFRRTFLDGRTDDALVYAMLTSRGELGARTFPIGALN